jgi:hypothetical protein
MFPFSTYSMYFFNIWKCQKSTKGVQFGRMTNHDEDKAEGFAPQGWVKILQFPKKYGFDEVTRNFRVVVSVSYFLKKNEES